jgi:L-ascorbate metabolism protein UlaG (beta-lactamase superfamily)
MKNGQHTEQVGFKIEAIPMYNLPESDTSFHTKGRGNGYVVEKHGERIYISGDTSGIPEMRSLQNIDLAFVAMDLPYTMGVEEAADAVLAFKPRKIYPYHYRTPLGFSDVAKFKRLVNSGNPATEVVQLNWYP